MRRVRRVRRTMLRFAAAASRPAFTMGLTDYIGQLIIRKFTLTTWS